MRLGQLMYLIQSNNSPIPQNLLLKLSWSHEHNTRKKQPLRVPNITNCQDKHSFVYNMVKLWNSVSIAKKLNAHPTLGVFKKCLRGELIFAIECNCSPISALNIENA